MSLENTIQVVGIMPKSFLVEALKMELNKLDSVTDKEFDKAFADLASVCMMVILRSQIKDGLFGMGDAQSIAEIIKGYQQVRNIEQQINNVLNQ